MLLKYSISKIILFHEIGRRSGWKWSGGGFCAVSSDTYSALFAIGFSDNFQVFF